MRADGRDAANPRPITIETGYLEFPAGSCLISTGRTKVICAASVEDKVPRWLKGRGRGWVTAEYSMLPASTPDRVTREASRGRQDGRTVEIQRLIGRALRASVHMKRLGERQIRVDCDVIQADGGTRTASITGAWVALALAIRSLEAGGAFGDGPSPLLRSISAISAGIVRGEALLDLDYPEDSNADVDMNFVIDGDGGLIEVQGTAEGEPFSPDDLNRLLTLALGGCAELTKLQRSALVAAEAERTP